MQIPLSKQVRSEAEKVALSHGFSSLQEVVRIFLTKLAAKKIEVTLQESIQLSDKNDKRYMQMTEDFKSNRNVFMAKNASDLTKLLREHSVS